ncbi:hypothetical protein, partial [Massilia genomosp. 1]|uniref:hypothetical protein n=1 Tax=Massilia genomosp. 1 TaxID=2609280 RepID=UPI001C9E944E
PNWPTSGEHDFSSLFRDIGGNLIGYGGGIMANLIFKAWGCRTVSGRSAALLRDPMAIWRMHPW